jgi:hypothetical protein
VRKTPESGPDSSPAFLPSVIGLAGQVTDDLRRKGFGNLLVYDSKGKEISVPAKAITEFSESWPPVYGSTKTLAERIVDAFGGGGEGRACLENPITGERVWIYPSELFGQPALSKSTLRRDALVEVPIPANIPPVAAPKAEPAMGTPMVENKKVFVHEGVPYQPLSEAASAAQTHRTTLLHWIKNKTIIGGRPLQSFYLAALDSYLVSEESIQRAASRFIKWPSKEPAGPVSLGETADRSGFIGFPEALRILGISNRTMWLWATQGKAPTGKALDVIKCPISKHLYIREKEVFDLKKLIPRSGLQRGRRPQVTLHP